MRNRVGGLLIGIGALHTFFGLVRFKEPIRGILADGVFDAVSDAARGEAFWFVFGGLVLLLLGYSLHHQERRGLALAPATGWSLLGLALFGILLLPLSGFWFLLVPALAGLGSGGSQRRV